MERKASKAPKIDDGDAKEDGEEEDEEEAEEGEMAEDDVDEERYRPESSPESR